MTYGNPVQRRACAIYTRKSVEEGLDMEYNTLDAQRDAGESYVASQRSNGWVCLPDRYDDGGFSGGNTNRPALKRLLDDCASGKVDIVVVYKIDRLSRSISDFADLTKKFDEWGVSFCAVTQDINTATSAGRMMVNILITFAQYEREVIGERIRDKFAASKRKGMWMGGIVPIGYKTEDRRLVVVPEKADIVRRIFRRYAETQSPKAIARELNDKGLLKKPGRPWTAASVHKVLRNCVYAGKVRQGDDLYPGEHEAIVDEALWREVQEFMDANARDTTPSSVGTEPPLKGLLWCGHCGGPMQPYRSVRRGVTYTYYRCGKDARRTEHTCPVRQISAQTVEDAVFARLSDVLRSPRLVAALSDETGLTEARILRFLGERLWENADGNARRRLCLLLLERVTLREDELALEIKDCGVRTALEENANG